LCAATLRAQTSEQCKSHAQQFENKIEEEGNEGIKIKYIE